MGFMDNLAANPRGDSSIYGNPGIQKPDTESALYLVNQLKDREMKDFKDKSNFMSDLSLRQEGRMRALYDPNNQPINQQTGKISGPGGEPQNTVMAQDPNQLTGYQKGELGVKQQELNLNSQRLAQTGKLGQEAIDIRGKQETLNQQKSDQINKNKQADMERKAEEFGKRFEAMQAELERKTKAGEDTLQLHKDIAANVKERHELEMEKMKHDMNLKDEQFNELKKRHEDLTNERENSQTTTEINSDGTKRTTTTKKGDVANTVSVIGKDGKTYNIPKNKLNDKDADGTPHWKQQ